MSVKFCIFFIHLSKKKTKKIMSKYFFLLYNQCVGSYKQPVVIKRFVRMDESIPNEETIGRLWDDIVRESSLCSCENVKWLQASEDVALFANRDSRRRYPRGANEVVLDGVCQLAVKHLNDFAGIFDRLKVTENNYLETFYQVADESIRTPSHTWGMVLTLFTFSEYMTRELPSKSENIGKMTGVYIVTRMGEQIRKEGGWMSFYTFCNEDARVNNSLCPCPAASLTCFCVGLLNVIAGCIGGMR
jgi:hypothetical protein